MPDTEAHSLSQSLRQILEQDVEDGLTVGEILKRVEDKGYGLLLVVLALPSALPVPAAGYSTPFGLMLAFLGVQMLIGRKSLWLPGWAMRLSIKRNLAEKMVGAAAKFFDKIEHLIKPRFSWIGGRWGLPLMGVLVIIMSMLMILPIPLTNTAPAGVVFLIGVGLSEDDGLFAGIACFLGALSVALYAYVIYIFVTVGVDGVMALKDKIKEALGF